jgi:hypothetical protein
MLSRTPNDGNVNAGIFDLVGQKYWEGPRSAVARRLIP